MTGRCYSLTCFPLRQPRRISNLFPRVAVISQSEGGDVGPAVTPPRGCRATPIHPGLVALPGSGAVLETPVAASLDAACSLTGAPGGHVVERVGSDVTAIFLYLGRRPAKNADQYIAESFGSVAPSVFGSTHVHKHEGSHDREVVKPVPEFGNVCRVLGN